LAGKVWRIGLMGYASNEIIFLHGVNALEAVLSQDNAHIDRGVAAAAVQVVYS